MKELNVSVLGVRILNLTNMHIECGYYEYMYLMSYTHEMVVISNVISVSIAYNEIHLNNSKTFALLADPDI